MTPHDDAPAVGRAMRDTPAERDELREKLRHLTRDPGPLGSAVCVLLKAVEAEFPVMVMPDKSRAILDLLAAARPAPETREPDGWVVDAPESLPSHVAQRVVYWGPDAKRRANNRVQRMAEVFRAFAVANPVYLGAPAPAEATEADSPKWATRRIAELAERDFERVNTPAAEATEARDAMDFCPTCKHPRWTTACQCAEEATEASGEMVGWLEVAEPCTDPFHFRLDGPTGAQQCPRCGSRMKVAPASGEPSGADAAVREALDAIKKAHTAVDDLCSGNSWTMSIPARPDADHDLVIDDALTKAERVIRLLADIPTAPGAPEEGAGDAE